LSTPFLIIATIPIEAILTIRLCLFRQAQEVAILSARGWKTAEAACFFCHVATTDTSVST